jgi:uncharacterized 2Fe-2S/4Fe-4S cluster protein (DUF4445 family)
LWGKTDITVDVIVDGVSEKFTVRPEPGDTISDAIKKAGLFLSMPCGGEGRCGKCLVMTKGGFPPVGAVERRLLERAPASPAGYETRIACLCGASGGDVLIPGGRRKISVADIAGDMPQYDGGEDKAYGIAADIGTTTISTLLFSFTSREAVASAHEMNRQGSFGADILSRIDHSNRNGVDGLRRCVTSQLDGMMSCLIREAGIGAALVTRLVIAGNTTMLHFLMGLDPRGIGAAPFTPESLFGDELPASGLFPFLENAAMYLPPSISAYIGADITSGILSTNITAAGGAKLLIDVGTNGEMALFAGSRLLCCATAAGPAFEGAAISMGMPAVSGAVSKIISGGATISCVTIDDAPPSGICGSGMISAVDMMLRAGVLDGGGRIMESGHEFTELVSRSNGEVSFALGDSGVSLTQRDIRNIQLVKASIAAGARILLKEAGICVGDVEALYLSGGFGSTIDPAEAAGIGLIPEELKERTVAVGNTALAGAAKLLFSRSLRNRMTDITSMASEISLSHSADFMEEYVERMPFWE